ncbi:cytochrome P450 [Panacagrimonas perspica]|uniref:Cytochrome P450 n=1 Tax=Panacagrimonas perspica TaxID=381431 RepID=A0A4S3K3H5_9GAMM|nr:cytochrome P450 [Panacagrimonas perspica]TDU31226.1 cytochrome P450 [Panacagrimonas perspica]THD02579.1 cytochrome [Panacagrimonas perspica]
MSVAEKVSAGTFEARDLYAPEVISNPYPYYAMLRDKPIQFGLEDYPPGTIPGVDKPIPSWVILKYADLVHCASNHATFSSRDRMQEASDAASLMLVNHDQPEHTRLRNIARKAFTPKRVESDVGPWLKAVVNEMLDDEGDGYLDFMENLAADLPARFIAKLLGTPQKDCKRIRGWSDAFMGTSHLSMEEKVRSNAELLDYYTEQVTRRYADIEAGRASDDLLTGFILAEDGGKRLTPMEVIRFCITMVAGGAESSVYLLGNQVAAMLEMPDLYQKMRADRSLVRPFLEESIRRDGPIQRLFRECTEDTEVSGTKMKKGDWVALFFASGNRDPAFYERPDEFILHRPNVGKNLTFSHGIHHCIAAAVARNEAAEMINGILDRYARVEPGDGPVVYQSAGFINYGPKSCPVKFVRG